MNALGKSPRAYNYGEFWTSNFCPNCTYTSAPFLIWMVNTIVYLLELVSMIFTNGHLYDLEFLGPNPSYLNSMQAMNPWEVRYNYQIWRPITALFLSTGF